MAGEPECITLGSSSDDEPTVMPAIQLPPPNFVEPEQGMPAPIAPVQDDVITINLSSDDESEDMTGPPPVLARMDCSSNGASSSYGAAAPPSLVAQASSSSAGTSSAIRPTAEDPAILAMRSIFNTATASTSSFPVASSSSSDLPSSSRSFGNYPAASASSRSSNLPAAARPVNGFPAPRFVKREEWQSNGTTKVHIFRPTMEEMADLSAYLEKKEREQGPQLSCGICKIIPPKEWHPQVNRTYDCNAIDKIIIRDAVKETSTPVEEDHDGVYLKSNRVYRKVMTARDYRAMAFSAKYDAPKNITTLQELEKYYWKNTMVNEPIYGADTPGTLYDDSVETFNITKLGTILDLLNEEGVEIKGVNTPYLYFGMYKTTFAWHAEDMDLYSINYVHLGEPKFWYAIPPEAADRFERLAAQFFPDAASKCRAFLRHKMFQISPQVLRHHGIPFGTMIQYPGEFIVTFPRGYHMGFNTGFNIAEATNFALDRWIDYGKNIVMCKCSNDAVEINMKKFVQKYRSAEFDEWHRYWYEKRFDCPKEDFKAGITNCTLEVMYPNMTREFQVSAVIACHQVYCGQEKMKKFQSVFQTRPSLLADREFNTNQGKIFPNCAVCQYFVPDLNLYSQFPADYPMPIKSRRYANNQMFHKNKIVTQPGTLDPIEDDLLTCAQCRVVVHRHCYAIICYEDGERAADYFGPGTSSFLCYRCRNRAKDLVEHTVCHLCPMRAGAMIPAVAGCYNKNLFAHVICALVHRRSKVLAIPGKKTPLALTLPSSKLFGKDPSNHLIQKLNPFKLNFDEEYLASEHSFGETPRNHECELCHHMGEGLVKCGLCEEAGPRHMHVTCGRLLEVVYEARIFPEILLPVCSIHNAELPPYFKKDVEFRVGDEVRVIDCNDNMRLGIIVDLANDEKRHTVDFLDGNRSTDLGSEDFQRCECNERLCDRINHIYGSIVYITWDDNAVYEAYYRGYTRDVKAKVKIDIPQDIPAKVQRFIHNYAPKPVDYDISEFDDIYVSTDNLMKVASSPPASPPKKAVVTSRRGRGRKRR